MATSSKRHGVTRARGRSVAALLVLLTGPFALVMGQAAPAAAAVTFVVNSTADAVDVAPGNGTCATASGACTLRAAIQEANAVAGRDTVQVPAGAYVLTVPPAGENLADSGDLDILAPVTVVGVGSGATTVTAGPPAPGAAAEVRALDRLLEIHPGAGDVTISGIALRNGWDAEAGGAILSSSQGRTRLVDVRVTGSTATVVGGGIYHGESPTSGCVEPCLGTVGDLDLVDTVLSGNSTGGEGGGLYVQLGRVTVSGGSIVDNTAATGGGAHVAGEVSASGLPTRLGLTGVTVSGNEAGTGGGVSADQESVVTVTGSTFEGNLAESDGGGLAATSMSTLTISSSTFRDNRSVGSGAGVATATSGEVVIAGSTFERNEAGTTITGPDGLPVEGDGGGGGLAMDGTGPVSITGSSIIDNRAVGAGGGLAIDTGGSVEVTDTIVVRNHAHEGGGGLVNAGMRVSFTRLTITDNTTDLDGGGILGEGSGDFTISDSTIARNRAENGGGFANEADGATRIERTLIWDNRAVLGFEDDSGLGGGVYGLGDAEARYENVTVVGNFAQSRGGGIYIDADAPVHIASSTITGNRSPIASGVGGEDGSPNVPVVPSTAVLLRNTIVAGNLSGPNCSFAVGSEGGNIQGDASCYLSGERDRTLADPGLDAVADNGGPTLTAALQPDSYAVDGGVTPCPAVDQRGVGRPKNVACDVGAFEFEGPFPPADTSPPDTEFVEGPVQDTEATSIFRFTGTDDATPADRLVFECRLLEFDPTEPPEPVDPTEPVAPEFQFVGCQNPWQVPLIEAGTYTFEVRAIDRSGNVDPTPVEYTFTAAQDVTPPETFFLETPTNPSTRSQAFFTFGATDDQTPEQFLEFECRIDSNEPDAWLECADPAVYANLTVGPHTVQVRAADGNDNVDPSPATFTWTVLAPVTCDDANITLFADQDTWVDQARPFENLTIDPQLRVASGPLATNARTLVRFPTVVGAPGCALESATLRLYAGSSTDGRQLQAVPLAGPWGEATVSWNTQPGVVGAVSVADAGDGYREWDVLDEVEAMRAGTLANHGFLVRDAVEDDAEGGDQVFVASEAAQDPPTVTVPQLVVRFEPADVPVPPAPTPAATETEVTCGQFVTESIRLADDLVGCLGEGLVVGAPDIDIDLNGHTISSGVVVDPGEEDGLLAGIRNGGHANVVIRNGTVRGFGYGVRLLPGTIHNLVTGLRLEGNINAGVDLLDADNGRNGNTIRGNVFERNGDGVALFSGTERTLVVDNVFGGNVGRAVYALDSSRNVIEDNEMSGLTNDPLLDSDGGVSLEGSTDNVVRANIISDTGDAGVLVSDGSHRTLVEANVLSRSSDSGISVAGSDGTVIRANVVHLSGGAGIAVSDGVGGAVTDNDVRFNPGGVELSGTSSVLVARNNATGTQATGISVEGGLLNEIVDNIAEQTGADGISIQADALDALGAPVPGNIVRRNRASHNLGDGISVSDGGHVVADNEAHGNGAYGIVAGSFVVDGGNNRASGNAEPVQCVGVVCGPGTAPTPATPDLTPPDTLILTAPPTGSSSLSPQPFTFTGTDNVAPATALRFECRLDAPPDPPAPPVEPPEPGEPIEPPQPPDVENWHECGSPVVYSLVPSGSHTFEVRAIDPFDNVDLTPATYVWSTIGAPPGPDAVPPSTAIAGGPDDPSVSTTATFDLRGSDNVTPGPNLVFECRLDSAASGAFVPCADGYTVTGLPLGVHTLDVRAIDLQGNVDPTPASYTWTVVAPPADSTPPETVLGSTPAPTTVATTASFTFSSPEAGITFRCSLDGAATASCTSPASYAGLAVGAHTFTVAAVDGAGNADPTPASFAWTVGPAPVPTAATCGTVLTQSTLLTADLVNCPVDGLVIGASSITVDLGGRIVDGIGLGRGIVNDGFDGVTIVNGAVQQFDVGVQLNAGADHSIVSDLVVQLNEVAGVALANADHAVVRDLTLAGNGNGISILAGTSGALVTGNTTGGSAGTSLALVSASGNRVEGNVLLGAALEGVLLVGATGNTVADNEIGGNSGPAIHLSAASNGNRIEANRLSSSEVGIELAGADTNVIAGNVVRSMAGPGILLAASRGNTVMDNSLKFNSGGIDLEGATANRLEGNDASENDGAGISLGDQSLGNEVVANTANANVGAGITVGDRAGAGTGTLIDGNTASFNGGYGIYVGDVGHMIRGNAADYNGSLGIYAAQGAGGVNADGGGNTAIGNTGGALDPVTGLLEQCVGVACNGVAALPTDTTPPNTSLLSAPPNPSTTSAATFAFTGTDNATTVTFQCRLDSTDPAAFVPCQSPRVLAGLALGTHTFEVRAVDFAGNVDPTPVVRTWLVEAPPAGVAPDTTILTGPDATTVATTATFSFASNEAPVTFQCRVDGGAATACSSPATFGGLAPGVHTLAVAAVDGEGLVDPTPATFTWTVGVAPVATTVSCGQVVTASIRLTNDLVDCAVGLIVGASGITIDLDGHVVDGIGLAEGIRNNGFDSVTITNGTVQEFDHGVLLGSGSASGIVSNLTLQLNQEAGILLSDADQAGVGNIVRANQVLANRWGIQLLAGTQGTLVTANTVTGSSGDGILVQGSAGNRLEANVVSGSSEAGIALEAATATVVIDNTLSGNSGTGIAVGSDGVAADSNRIEGNDVSGSGADGIALVDSANNDVVGNTVAQSGGAGLSLIGVRLTLVLDNQIRSNAAGIELEQSVSNQIEGNEVTAGSGTGISLQALSFDNVLLGNNASSNSGIGIHVTDVAPAGQPNVVDANVADGNGSGGIFVEGSGHVVVGNTADLNDGWGLFVAPGNTDGGGNAATGNAEPAQCSGVVCLVGVPAGAPDTSIVARPSNPSDSRNALFTFTGSDDTTPVADLGFECRLDSASALDWVACENPQEFLALAPGSHTFEVRAVDAADLVDPSPATFTWDYVALPTGEAPDTFIGLAPPLETPLFEALFTFSADEPDVTFECSLDGAAFAPCAFAFEAEFEETQVGLHEFRVRATDFEGNTDPTPAVHQWTIGGVLATVTDGPAYEPGAPGEPATGGETESTTAVFTFEANVADATFLCSLDLQPFVACTSPLTFTGLNPGEHLLRIIAGDPDSGAEQLEPTEYEWVVLLGADTTPPETVLTGTPPDLSSDTAFTFTGTDDQTQSLALTFECRLDSTDPADFAECASPFNLLTLFPDLAPGPHTFEVRAVDTAEPDGNVDPTPATHQWTSVADVTPPQTALALPLPAVVTVEPDVTVAFGGTDNATPLEAVTFECAVDGGLFAPCDSPQSVQGLLPGPHVFAVRAVDLAGNADPTPAVFGWTQVGPPAVTITSAPPAVSASRTASFIFTSDQPGTTFTCAVDGGAFVPCASPLVLEGLPDGVHTVGVLATNAYQQTGPVPATVTWTVAAGPDVDAPVTTLTVVPPPVSLVDTATFEFVSNEVVATFECSLDGAPYVSCTSPREVSGLLDGPHQFAVRAVDAAGNVDPDPAVHTWQIDLPPVAEILNAPEPITEATVATFEFTSNEPGSTFECWLDGPIGPCTSPFTVTGLAPGPHVFAVQAIDAGGRRSLEFNESEWTVVASAPPETSFTSAVGIPATVTEDTGATFSFGGTDNATPAEALVFECSLDGAPFGPCTSPVAVADLAEGAHTFRVHAVDAAGAADPTPATWAWTVVPPVPPDTSAPVTTITSAPPAITLSSSAEVTFTADEPGAVFECAVDGAGAAPCVSPVVLTDLAVGPHTLVVRAVDAAGNVESPGATVSWAVVPDTTAPTTTITAGPTGANGLDEVTFEFSAVDDLTPPDALDVECSLDGGPFAPCTSPHPVTGLQPGPHTFAVRAADAGGNREDPGAVRSWTTVDITAPVSVVAGAPAAPTEATAATFVLSASEPGVTFECALDGAAFAACTSPVTVSGLTVGSHTFAVRATDASGNVEATPVVVAWVVVDLTPPGTAIVSGPPASGESPVATFTFTADQPGATFECALDGGPFAGCATPHQVSGLATGSHVLLVRAIDPSGNTDPTPASFTWSVVDLTPPGTVSVSGPPASTDVTSATFAFTADETGASFRCALDGAAPVACTSPVTVTGLGVGSHTFAVQAVDAAGNADPTPVTFSWTVLAPPPQCGAGTTLTATADSWLEQGSPTGNKGTDSVLKVFSKSGNANQRTVVRFTMPSLPAGCVVESATLRMFAGSARNGRTLQAVRLNATWSETGVTWSNQPATVGPAATTASGTGWRQWNVRDQVTAAYGAGAHHGFLVRDASEGNDHEQQFRSREHANDRPQLIVTFAPAPAPDTVPPDTAITSGPAATTTTATTAVVAFTGSDAVTPVGSLSYQCRLDGAAFTACVSPLTISGLAVGAHVLDVRAVDGAGLVDPTPSSVTWTVEAPPPDTLAPETSVVSGPASGTTSTSASIAFTSDDPAATFACSLDGGAFAPCTSPVAYTGLAVGSHQVAVRATDAAANTDPTPAVHAWTVTAPAACTATTVTVPSVADTWVLQSSATANHGTDSIAKVDSKSGSGNARALFRFEIPAAPAGCTITGAQLRLYAGSATTGRTLQALRVSAAWAEGTATWANQPATTGPAATTASGTGWRQWSVTSQVQAMAGGANHGFLIRDAAENSGGREQQFHTREKAPDSPPQLVITYG